MQSNAARLFLLVSCVTCTCVGHSGQYSPAASPTLSKGCHLQTHSVLALRGGQGDEERQHGADEPHTFFGEELSSYDDQDPVAEARMQIGRLLDDMAPYWTVDESVETPKDKLWKPVSRSDWRGAPIAMREGFQLVTRATLAKRFNGWLKTDLSPHLWSNYTRTFEGEFVLDNQTVWPEEEYGVGGRPGWLGYGMIDDDDMLKWVEEGGTNVMDEIKEREAYEYRKYGDKPIYTWGPDEWRPNADLIPASLHKNVSGPNMNKIDALLDQGAAKVRERKYKTDRCAWTREEDRTLLAQFKRYGTAWSEVCKLIPGRTTNACKNRWTKLQVLQPDILKGVELHPLKGQEKDETVPVLKGINMLPTASNGTATKNRNSSSGNSTAQGLVVAKPQQGGRVQPESRLDPRLVEILKFRKDEIAEMAKRPDFTGMPRDQRLMQILRMHERLKGDPVSRAQQRLDRVGNATLGSVIARLEEEKIGTAGLEDILRVLCADAEMEPDIVEGALERFAHLVVKVSDPVFLEAMRKKEIMKQTAYHCKVYEDLLLEREIRNDTTRRFKNENGRLVELPPRDPFNHTHNRETLIRELDPRIEWGIPTEYDKEVTWIYDDEERKWYEGGEPDWSRLGEIADREEAAAANGSNDKVLVTADEMEEHLLEKMKYRETVREQEQLLLSDKRYNELEDEYEDDIVPWELRKRTFGAGGIDEDGKWQYGDGTYPYNPSPFAGWVDGRNLLPGELDKLNVVMKDEYTNYGDVSNPYPWRGQNPYFDTAEAAGEVAGSDEDGLNDEGVVGGNVHGDMSIFEGGEVQGGGDGERGSGKGTVGDVMKGRFGDGGDKSVSVMAKGMKKAFGVGRTSKSAGGVKRFGASSATAKDVMGRGSKGGGEGGLDVLARGLQKSLGGGIFAKREGASASGGTTSKKPGLRRVEDVGIQGGEDVLAKGLMKSIGVSQAGGREEGKAMGLGTGSIDMADEESKGGSKDKGKAEDIDAEGRRVRVSKEKLKEIRDAQGRGRILTDWRTEVDQDCEDDLPRMVKPEDDGWQVIRKGGIKQIEAEFPDYFEYGGGMLAHGNPWEHSASVIWLHAEGDQGSAWCRVQWGLVFEWVNFIFPNAKVQSGTIACIDSNGTVPESGPADEPPGPDEDDPTPPGVVRSWFGVKEHTTEGIGSDQRNVEDEASLSRSAAFVNCHVQAEVDKGVDPSRIFLVGFGQGGATALAAACNSLRHKIGGVACISGWLPFNLPLPPPVLPKSRKTGGCETTTSWGVNATGAAGNGSLDNRSIVDCLRVPGHMRDVPIWLMHGSEDDVIPVEAANFSAQRLSQLGFSNVTVHEYHGRQHKLSEEMVDDLYHILLWLMPKQDSEVEYIHKDKFLDYSHSARSTGRSLPDRRGMPSGQIRLDPAQIHEGPKLPTTGSRMKAPEDDITESDSEGDESLGMGGNEMSDDTDEIGEDEEGAEWFDTKPARTGGGRKRGAGGGAGGTKSSRKTPRLLDPVDSE